jgi:hypothetical protein
MPQVHLFGHIHEQRGHWDRTILPGEQGDAASFPLINEPVRADFKHPDPGQIHAKAFWQERHVCLEVAA